MSDALTSFLDEPNSSFEMAMNKRQEAAKDTPAHHDEAVKVTPSPRAHALEEAIATVRAKGERIKKEANAFQDVGASLEATIRIKVCDEIRALSSQPLADALPQDVINLVIAAREVCDTWQLADCEFKKLDKALEPFSERVPYENEPDALPASEASE